MPEKWTGELIGDMHNANVSVKELAEAVGWNPKYLSVVLHCHKKPKNAQSKLRNAFNEIVAGRVCEQQHI